MNKYLKKAFSLALTAVMMCSAISFGSMTANGATVSSTKLLSADGLSNSSVKIKWKRVKNVKGYIVYRKTGTSKYKSIKKITSNKTVSLTDKGLKANAKYTYKVRTFKILKGKTKYGKYSNAKSVKTFHKIDTKYFANRGYELKNMLGQQNISKPEEINIEALVQYAFCHLYYKDLKDMPENGMTYRSATADEISKEIEKQFNIKNADIKSSILYNRGKDIFEMWEPHYGTEYYSSSKLSRVNSTTYKVKSSYYSDAKLKNKLDTITVTVKVSGSKQYIYGVL